jgi:hypothetical protein
MHSGLERWFDKQRDLENNDKRDMFYVVVLPPHQRPGKVDPAGGVASRVTMWPLEMKRSSSVIADADADAEERCAVHNGHRGEKKKPWKFQATPMEQAKEVAKQND